MDVRVFAADIFAFSGRKSLARRDQAIAFDKSIVARGNYSQALVPMEAAQISSSRPENAQCGTKLNPSQHSSSQLSHNTTHTSQVSQPRIAVENPRRAANFTGWSPYRVRDDRRMSGSLQAPQALSLIDIKMVAPIVPMPRTEA